MKVKTLCFEAHREKRAFFTGDNMADLDHDDSVGIIDLMLLCEDWLWAEYLLDTNPKFEGVVDITYFSVFANQWLWVEP